MNALSTMLLIADTFVALCDEMPLKKVSISDIIERTGKNRKTFYYHFENKDCLITWIFRYDLGQELKRRFPESTLVYETGATDCFAHVLEAKRNFYTQALADTNPYSLRNYLYHLYLPALRNDIDLILANRYLPQENIQFLAEFYTCAFLYYFIRKCDQPGADRLTGQAGPFANIIHSSLEAQIKEAQLRRNL